MADLGRGASGALGFWIRAAGGALESGDGSGLEADLGSASGVSSSLKGGLSQKSSSAVRERLSAIQKSPRDERLNIVFAPIEVKGQPEGHVSLKKAVG